MVDIKLRKAKPEDFSFIWKLYSDSVAPLLKDKSRGGWNEKEQKNQFSEIFSESDTRLILKGDEEVGWIDYRLEDNHLQLANGYITPEHRRKGIMSTVLNGLITTGMIVQASTIKGNPYNAFLDKWGFETINEEGVFETKSLKK